MYRSCTEVKQFNQNPSQAGPDKRAVEGKNPAAN
jgi:hypothetical protein